MANEESKNVAEKKELARNIFVATTGVVPVVGGVLSFFLDKYLPSAVETRKNLFLAEVEKDLEKIPKEIIEQMYNNSEYHSIMLKIFKHALEEFRKEKINAFRNILINATMSHSVSFDEQSFYIKLTTDLTVDQIRILHMFYLRDYKKTLNFGKGNSINEFMKESWPEVDESYRFALITEIIRYGLITSSKKSQREKGEGHQLSPFGERFIEYIFTPIEMDSSDANK